MVQGILLWNPNPYLIQTSHTPKVNPIARPSNRTIFATASDATPAVGELSAKERRRLRNERRESKMGQNWREEVEMSLLKKPTKRFANWKDELNLDTLADLGPQWWSLKVSRARVDETVDLVARLLARDFPQLTFKVCNPAVKVKRKLKSGSISVTSKPLFPGCIFIRCELNREIHEFIRECNGVGGFIGAKVGNTKKQINKPRPVDEIDMEAIFKQVKEDQEKHDKEFEEEEQKRKQQESLNVDPGLDSDEDAESLLESKPKRKSRKSSDPEKKKLVPGSVVRVVSGDFTEFEGSLKKVNRRTKKVTVGFTLFGKESLVDLDMNEIVAQ